MAKRKTSTKPAVKSVYGSDPGQYDDEGMLIGPDGMRVDGKAPVLQPSGGWGLPEQPRPAPQVANNNPYLEAHRNIPNLMRETYERAFQQNQVTPTQPTQGAAMPQMGLANRPGQQQQMPNRPGVGPMPYMGQSTPLPAGTVTRPQGGPLPSPMQQGYVSPYQQQRPNPNFSNYYLTRPRPQQGGQAASRPQQVSNPGQSQPLPHNIGGLLVGRPGTRPAGVGTGGGGGGPSQGMPSPSPMGGMGAGGMPPSMGGMGYNNSAGGQMGAPPMVSPPPGGFDMSGYNQDNGWFPTMGQAMQNAGWFPGGQIPPALQQQFQGFGIPQSGMTSSTTTTRMPRQSQYRVRRQSYSY